MQIANYISEYTKCVEKRLHELIPESSDTHEQLYRAARYSLMEGGKRIRPLFTLITAEALGSGVEEALTPACSIELVHTYSIIHDDLPCMDDDDYRRGKPTLHRAFSEAHAVLTGDYLLTYAFEILARAPLLTSEQKLSLIATLSKNIGGEGLIGGQIMDLEAAGHQIELKDLEDIHLKKTGKLISTAIEFGGIIAHATKQELEILEKFGARIGLAFQIIDDVLDITASQTKHGQNFGSDVANDKTTYMTLMGTEKATNTAQALVNDSLKQLKALPYDFSNLENLAKFIVQRKI